MFNAKQIKENMVKWIAETIPADKNAVIAVDGCRDSTVAAALCVEALGKERVVGVVPYIFNNNVEKQLNIIKHFGIRYIVIDIEDSYWNILSQIDFLDRDVLNIEDFEEIKPSEKAKEDLIPRLNMSTVYVVAQSVNGLVINTRNLTNMWIGNFTDWGNVGDINLFNGLLSDEIVKIGRECGLSEDFLDYDYTDNILNNYIRADECDDYEKNQIDKLHDKNLYKMKPAPFYIPKYDEVERKLFQRDLGWKAIAMFFFGAIFFDWKLDENFLKGMEECVEDV